MSYYVIKFKNKYLAPYVKEHTFYTLSNIEEMYSENRDFAVRFPTAKLAHYYKSLDFQFRQRGMFYATADEREKCRQELKLVKIVKVNKKKKLIH